MKLIPEPGGPCWVLSGGFPCGARDTGAGEPQLGSTGRQLETRWLLVCVMGTVLPQLYRRNELHRISAAACAKLGLCPHCLGFGRVVGDDPENSPVCPQCNGSGRAGLRTHMERIDQGGLHMSVEITRHAYVTPRRDTVQACLACGHEENYPYHLKGT